MRDFIVSGPIRVAVSSPGGEGVAGQPEQPQADRSGKTGQERLYDVTPVLPECFGFLSCHKIDLSYEMV
jgi:hypothetical protein